ncbi:hypothetical protein VARIO8X_130162 [Burkholderiales bacterium 8X]|nr:hypothetical protein VARIO8X_130162 [Burkholderiales bacterium 8X]
MVWSALLLVRPPDGMSQGPCFKRTGPLGLPGPSMRLLDQKSGGEEMEFPTLLIFFTTSSAAIEGNQDHGPRTIAQSIQEAVIFMMAKASISATSVKAINHERRGNASFTYARGLGRFTRSGRDHEGLRDQASFIETQGRYSELRFR